MWGMGMPMTPAPVAAGCGGGRPALAMVTGDPSQPPPPAGPAPWAPAGPATPGGMGAPTMAAPTMMFQQAAAMPGITQGPHPMASMPSAQRTELAQDLDRFIANSSIDSRAMASLRAQEPEVQRAVLDRGELSDCTNPSAALMGRIQVAKDHVNFERATRAQQGPSVAQPGVTAPTPPPSHVPHSSPEVEEFIVENRLDDSAARALRDADQAIQRCVLGLGNFKNCRNPSAVCLARIREARLTPQPLTEDRPQVLLIDGMKKSELEAEMDKFLEDSEVDSRAASALRAQAPEVQRAVLERGELTDCQNPSTALMGRIRVAHENLAFERKRALTPGGPGDAAAGAVKEPPAASQEVEDFIRENKIDGLAARQLREADQETQEDVVARGSLSDCRNPSAVCLARIRDSKSMAMARLESNKSAEPAKPSSGTSSQNTTVANMMVPMVSMPMGNPMMMMANMQASMGGMMPMAGMMPMGNMMMGGMGGM
mmetsp:Transcript_96666/g.298014  ORF Transcript_96666/g.298014 Transcript_96666/m.298014 type:complete len:485 (-) Transcript_96666:123-1577(-)